MEEKLSISRVTKNAGAYSFRIEGYSGLSHRTGDSVESPEFDLCNYTWQVLIVMIITMIDIDYYNNS